MIAGTQPWSGGEARAEEALGLNPPRLYFHTGVGVGYSHYWQIGGADRDVGGATLDIPITLAARLRPWLAIGAGGALELYPAHAGRNNISFNPIAETAGAGGYFGPALVFLSPKVVHGEVVVGVGGGGVNKVWGGVGLVVAPSVMFDVWSRGWSHLSIDLRAVYGQWAFPDNSAVRPFVGALAGVSYTLH